MRTRRLVGPAVLALVASTAGVAGPPAAAAADVPAVSGGAYGHYSKVSLFGGPPAPVGPLPDVRLPASGAEPPLTGYEAAGAAVYGPAHIFGGVWPTDVDITPPSGPITVSTRGATGARGSVTSSVDIVLRTPRDAKSPGGWGPLPPTQGDELHATCTATETGVSGSARFVNAVMSKATTASGDPLDEERVPDNPPANYTREGMLTNVGDRYRIVYNEQILDPDGGSITVNAVHVYLLGPVAVGESIVGQVRCSVRGAAFAGTPPSVAQPAQTAPPTTAAASSVPPPTGPPVTGPTPVAAAGSGGNAALPIVIGLAVVVGGGAAALATRRRRAARREYPHAP